MNLQRVEPGKFSCLDTKFEGKREKSKTERGSEGPGLALLVGAHIEFFAGEGRFGYATVAVSWQDV